MTMTCRSEGRATMRQVKEEITKEQYEDYAAMTVRDRMKFIEESVTDPCWLYGHGYYGNFIEADGSKYYIVHRIGETCD